MSIGSALHSNWGMMARMSLGGACQGGKAGRSPVGFHGLGGSVAVRSRVDRTGGCSLVGRLMVVRGVSILGGVRVRKDSSWNVPASEGDGTAATLVGLDQQQQQQQREEEDAGEELQQEAAEVDSALWENFPGWDRCWYPVAVEDLLDPKRPNAIQLLGRDLVLWKDGEGMWRCAEDVCPHRQVALSEGKIWDDGSLMCSYHGWRFGGDGGCVAVPQASSEAQASRICSGQRSCLKMFPLMISQELVWVWPQTGAHAEEESKQAKPAICEELKNAQEKGTKFTYFMRPFFRDLPYDFTTAIENIADPAHVPFSHHGVQGNRDKVTYGMYTMHPATIGKGKVGVTLGAFGSYKHQTLSLQPPCRLNYLGSGEDGEFFSFNIFATPTTPGNCRLVTFGVTTKKLPAIAKIFMNIPLFLDHLFIRLKVLDGDSVFLHLQEQRLRNFIKEGKTWKDAYYLPTRADLFVATCRKWLDRVGSPFGDGGFGTGGLGTSPVPLIQDERVALDRYRQHTMNCRKCKAALRWVEVGRSVMGAMAAASWAAFVFVCLGALPQTVGVFSRRLFAVSGLTSVVLTSCWKLLSDLRQHFYYIPYVHADK